MKKLLMMLALVAGALVATAGDNDIVVKVSVPGDRVSKAVKKELLDKAYRAACAKYVKANYANVGEGVMDKVLSEASKFFEGGEQPEDAAAEDGEVTAKYELTVKQEELAAFLKLNGVDGNTLADGTKVQIVIVEEKPDDGQMQLGDDVGKFFFNRYGMFQRRIRGKLVKEANKMDLDVILLEDNENFEDMKKKDPNLVGVYYDVNPDTRGFAATPDFLRKVQESNPDTIALYYRIDALCYDPVKKQIRTSVALSFKPLASNKTVDVGTKDFQFPTSNTQPDMIMADLGTAVESAMASLLNGEGAAQKIKHELSVLSKQSTQPKGPFKLVINCSQVDPKIKIRFRTQLKKSLIASGITEQPKLKLVKDTLSCTVTKKDIGDLDDLWGEVSGSITELLGDDVEVTDDWAKKNGETLTVTVGK